MIGPIAEEFPAFGPLDVEVPEGFEDRSWRVEACPCFVDDAHGLLLWIDYADRRMREFPNAPRFSLKRGTVDPTAGTQSGDAVDLVWSDDWAEVVERIAEVRRDAAPTP